MKLSEAIRLGAMNKPQAFGGYSVQGEAVCALGAAADAVGLPVTNDTNDRYYAIDREWPLLRSERPPHPEDWRNEQCDLRVAIWYLNDTRRLSRELIADFVASVEQRIDATRASAAVRMSVESPVAVTART